MLPLRTARQVLLTPNALRKVSLSPRLANPTLLRAMTSSAMSKRLEGKTIVITGASSGIGKSTAIEFARTSPKNLKLVLTARRIDKLKEIAEQIKQEVGDGVKVLPVKLDISNPEEVRGFVGGLPEEFKDIDVLVNNA
jgi:3-hydroxy acid dehydrogenase / malonic semialdehyde reductase